MWGPQLGHNVASPGMRRKICFGSLPDSRQCGSRELLRLPPKTHFASGSLGVSQGNHWVHFRRAPGWKVAGQNGDGKQKQRHDQKHSRIMRANAIEQTCHHGRSGCRNDHIRQRCPRQQARPPCVRTFQNVVPPRAQGHADDRSRAIFGRPYKPTSRKFRWRPEAPPVQQIRPPDRQKNGVKPVTDQGCRS